MVGILCHNEEHFGSGRTPATNTVFSVVGCLLSTVLQILYKSLNS